MRNTRPFNDVDSIQSMQIHFLKKNSSSENFWGLYWYYLYIIFWLKKSWLFPCWWFNTSILSAQIAEPLLSCLTIETTPLNNRGATRHTIKTWTRCRAITYSLLLLSHTLSSDLSKRRSLTKSKQRNLLCLKIMEDQHPWWKHRRRERQEESTSQKGSLQMMLACRRAGYRILSEIHTQSCCRSVDKIPPMYPHLLRTIIKHRLWMFVCT